MDIQFVGAASSLDVMSDNGRCRVVTIGTAATNVNIICANGDVSGTVGVVPAASLGGSFIASNGSVDLSFPGSQKFSVQAEALAGGTVDTGNAEAAGCTVEVTTVSSKTVRCNGATALDPMFSAQADGTSLQGITLAF